jgi:hypothetical protein
MKIWASIVGFLRFTGGVIREAVSGYFHPLRVLEREHKTVIKGDADFQDFDELMAKITGLTGDFVLKHPGDSHLDISVAYRRGSKSFSDAILSCPLCGARNRLTRGKAGAKCGACKAPLSTNLN